MVELLGLGETGGRTHVERACLEDDGGSAINLGRVDWADVDHRGDVLFAANGGLYRASPEAIANSADAAPFRLVADLNALTFQPVEAPEWARRWP